jgi:hypothetical protein
MGGKARAKIPMIYRINRNCVNKKKEMKKMKNKTTLEDLEKERDSLIELSPRWIAVCGMIETMKNWQVEKLYGLLKDIMDKHDIDPCAFDLPEELSNSIRAAEKFIKEFEKESE